MTSRCFDVWNYVFVLQYSLSVIGRSRVAISSKWFPNLSRQVHHWVTRQPSRAFDQEWSSNQFPLVSLWGLSNGLVFVPEGALTPLLLTSLSFPLRAYRSYWNDNCFSIYGQNNWAHFSKPQWPLKHLTTVTREINLGQLSIWVQTQRLSEIKLNDARGQFLVTSLLVGHLHLCGRPFTKCIEMTGALICCVAWSFSRCINGRSENILSS